jgi:hypothetical protein
MGLAEWDSPNGTPRMGLPEWDRAAALKLRSTSRTEKSQAKYHLTWDFKVEAKGLEPSNLLTASQILGVRGGPLQPAAGTLPGPIVRVCSLQAGEIRQRCLQNCLHFG